MKRETLNCFCILVIATVTLSSCTDVSDKALTIQASSNIEVAKNPFLDFLKDQQEAQLGLSKIPGAVTHIVKDSETYFQHLYGAKDVQSCQPVTENTLFRMGSLSKGFTGILAAKLHEKGIIDLEKPVVEYLPCLSQSNNEEVRQIKLYHLLSHSAGIVPHAYTLDIEAGVLPIDLCPKYEKLISVGQLGTHFYQNAFFALIEDIVEQQTGKVFSQVMIEELFDPLDICSVAFDHESYIESQDYAAPHRWSSSKKEYVKVPFKKKYFNAVSAGGICMSSSDMGKWMDALLGNRKDVISEKVLALAFEKHTDTRNDPRNVNKWSGVDSVHYGLGWRLVDYKGKQLIYHAGYVDAFRSEILIDPKEKLGIFAVLNCANSYAGRVIPSLLQSLESEEEIRAPGWEVTLACSS